MQVSVNWLKKYIDINSDIHSLAHELSMMGLEVDAYNEIEGTNDYLLEFDLTPNRGDCLGIINIAREVALIEGGQVRLPEFSINTSTEQTKEAVSIEVLTPDLCPRYAARIIKNVTVQSSPDWLKKAVESVGLRSINNIVDVTNFVMLENNQPLHAFDYDLLKNKKIVVRKAKEGEKLVTLDGISRELQANDLVISDGYDKAIALAGVMGGANTEITPSTVNILLESACFEGIGVRKTSKRLGLRTDSSVRFEKNIDINAVTYSLDRAAALIQEVAGGVVLEQPIDVYPVPREPLDIILSVCKTEKLLGIDIVADEIGNIFDRLGFAYDKVNSDLFKVTVPTYRTDITMEVDLIEEIAKVYGYENIPSKLPEGITTIGGLNKKQKFRKKITEILAMDMFETINYSFISPKDTQALDSNKHNSMPTIRIANPLSEEQSEMRTTLLPGLLKLLNNNVARQNDELAFFEIGAAYVLDDAGQINEPWQVAGVTLGKTAANWVNPSIEMDFFYLKGILEGLFHTLGIEVRYTPVALKNTFHPGRSAEMICQDVVVGVLGEIHPQVKQKFDLKGKVCAFEIDLEKLFAMFDQSRIFEHISKYPTIERDIAVIVEQDVFVGEVIDEIKRAAFDFLKRVDVFDVYTGEPVPEGKKSVALNFLWQADDHTLTDAEVNEQMLVILQLLQMNYKAQLRDK